MEVNIDCSLDVAANLAGEWTQIAAIYSSMAELLNSILENVKNIKKYAGRAGMGFDSYYKSDSEVRSKMRSNLSNINYDIDEVITAITSKANEATRRQGVYTKFVKDLTDKINECYNKYDGKEQDEAMIKGTFNFL